MKKILYFLVALPFIYMSCDPVSPEPEESSLNLNFLGTYGGQTLILGEHNDYPTGMQVNINALSFFLSEVTLITETGEEVALADVNLVNFSQNHALASTASNGETIKLNDVPEGNYTEIKFGLGLPATLNATNPADYESSHPLSKTEYYWDWRATYIFSVIEGTLDTLDNGTINPDVFLTYHCGSDAMFREVSIKTDFTIEKAQDTSIGLELDVEKIFIPDGTPYDIKTNNKTHTTVEDADIADIIMTNLVNAIGLKE